MPELPDVEATRRDLRRWLAGAKVVAARCDDRRVGRGSSPRAFAEALVGRTIEDVGRRGKWLRLVLDDGARVFSHLGMTGDWVRVPVEAPGQRFERARIDVERRGRAASVRYVDARRFGRLVVSPDDLDEWAVLGPDPLSDGIDPGLLSERLASRRRSVKEVLMDQRVVAGIGNVMATDALWLARVDPRSLGGALRPADVRAIVRGVHSAIARELAAREARQGNGKDPFYVYGRAGMPCPRCGKTLAKVTLGGRTTVLCAGCQVRRR